MKNTAIQLREENETLRAQLLVQQQLLITQQTELDHAQQRIASFQEQIQWLLHQRFGRRSEKYVDPKQLCLFNEAEQLADAAPEQALTARVTVQTHPRRRGKRTPLPAHFPRRRVEHDLPEAEKTCGCCGEALQRIAEVKNEQLEVIPATVAVIEHIRFKYACHHCQDQVKTAPQLPQMIPKSIASPSLLAYVISSKFVDGLPLYRQETIFARLNIDLCRTSMARWNIQVAQACAPLGTLLYRQVLAGPLLHFWREPFSGAQGKRSLGAAVVLHLGAAGRRTPSGGVLSLRSQPQWRGDRGLAPKLSRLPAVRRLECL